MYPSAPTTLLLTDRVREALAVTRRGVEELLPEEDWIRKLARSEATGTALRIKLGLDPTAPDIHIGHTVYYSLRRTLELLAGANPNILELLYMPEDCVRIDTPEMQQLRAHRPMFITISFLYRHFPFTYTGCRSRRQYIQYSARGCAQGRQPRCGW